MDEPPPWAPVTTPYAAWARSSSETSNKQSGGACPDCTPSGLRWSALVPHPKPCTVLANKRILFVGDSYVRHAFVAFVLWLSGDHAAGALKPEHDELCEGAGQFEEKVCRKQLIAMILLVTVIQMSW